MDIRPEILALVLACALVTALPRVLPLVILSRFALPCTVTDWLRGVPISVLAALLSIELLGTGAAGIVAVAAALLVACATKSLLGTVAVGVAAYWMLL